VRARYRQSVLDHNDQYDLDVNLPDQLRGQVMASTALVGNSCLWAE
jgi:hypothetical protein